MKKRGGSLENNMVFYIVVIIAFFNIVAFLTVRDWNSIAFFVLALVIANAFKINPILSLVIAIISANVFRASKSLQEGLKNKKHKPPKHVKPHLKKNDNPDPLPKEPKSSAKNAASTSIDSTTLEGLTSTANGLMERQDKLHDLAGQLGPLMTQASKMLKQLPEGFLQNAFQNKK